SRLLSMSARFIVVFALVIWAGGRSALSADAGTPAFAPEKYDVSRYAKIWKAQPFIKETPPPQGPDPLATRYALVGLVEAGENSVAFLDDGGKTIMLAKNHPDSERNLELLSITADKEVRKSSVKIRQGTSQTDLPFDTRGIVASGGSADPGAVNASAVPPPPPGVIAPQRPGMVPPPPPGASIPQPGQPPTTRRIITPGALNAPAPPSPPAANPNAEQPTAPTRRIIRPTPIDVSP
ncbi:MAG: hypothetical protein ACREKL_11505, partial [Chthoniobacterales bacterium]